MLVNFSEKGKKSNLCSNTDKSSKLRVIVHDKSTGQYALRDTASAGVGNSQPAARSRAVPVTQTVLPARNGETLQARKTQSRKRTNQQAQAAGPLPTMRIQGPKPRGHQQSPVTTQPAAFGEGMTSAFDPALTNMPPAQTTYGQTVNQFYLTQQQSSRNRDADAILQPPRKRHRKTSSTPGSQVPQTPQVGGEPSRVPQPFNTNQGTMTEYSSVLGVDTSTQRASHNTVDQLGPRHEPLERAIRDDDQHLTELNPAAEYFTGQLSSKESAAISQPFLFGQGYTQPFNPALNFHLSTHDECYGQLSSLAQQPQPEQRNADDKPNPPAKRQRNSQPARNPQVMGAAVDGALDSTSGPDLTEEFQLLIDHAMYDLSTETTYAGTADQSTPGPQQPEPGDDDTGVGLQQSRKRRHGEV